MEYDLIRALSHHQLTAAIVEHELYIWNIIKQKTEWIVCVYTFLVSKDTRWRSCLKMHLDNLAPSHFGLDYLERRVTLKLRTSQ